VYSVIEFDIGGGVRYASCEVAVQLGFALPTVLCLSDICSIVITSTLQESNMSTTPKLYTIEEIGFKTNWGFNGTFFNIKQPGFPQPAGYTEDNQPLYDYDEVKNWDHDRPTFGPITDVIIIRSIN
jgi:hypothetical protein